MTHTIITATYTTTTNATPTIITIDIPAKESIACHIHGGNPEIFGGII